MKVINAYKLLMLSIVLIAVSVPVLAADMEDYCVVPPYVKRDIKPNIMLLMDNSFITALPAYNSTTYDPGVTYQGLFRSDLKYTYPSNEYTPSAAGAYPGNLLNWVVTSRYDLIEKILLGGKSVSRQTNVNTLLGVNEGTWAQKTYTYTVAATTYTCLFDVAGDLTISENTFMGCGLLDGIGPVARGDFKTDEQYAMYMSSIMKKQEILKYGTSEETVQAIVVHLEPKEGIFDIPAAIAKSLLSRISASPASAAPPFKIASPTNNTTYTAYQGVFFSSPQPTAANGVEPYTWSIDPTGTALPAGLSINPATGVISGTPTTLGSSNGIKLKATDSNSPTAATDIVNINIDVEIFVGGVPRSQIFSIRVCIGDYVNNCDIGTTPEKAGILQDYWDQARFGIADFQATDNPRVEICVPANNEENFYTAIENAIHVGTETDITRLIDGVYEVVQAYKGTPSQGTCDPFNGDASPCRNNFMLFLTAGEGSLNPPSPNAGSPLVFSGVSTPAIPASCSALTYNLAKNACYGDAVDLRADKDGTQNVSSYIVNAMGVNGDAREAALIEAAANSNGNYYYVSDPTQLMETLKQAFQDIIKRAASGTAASVLASGEGSGANLIQAVYYPRRRFLDSATGTYDEIGWIGRLTNFWYYNDPFFGNNNMREDTTADAVLNLQNDYVADLYFDTVNERVRAERYSDDDGDGSGDTQILPDIDFENMKSIWEAGVKLWQRDLTTNPRTIYANVNGTGLSILNALSANDATVRTLIQAADIANATNIINYVHGYHISGYRDRRVKVDLNGDGDSLDAGETTKQVWKLGDVLNSTPRLASWIPLNAYDSLYGSLENGTYKAFTESSVYTDRGMAFTGGNDGMLHAFKLGTLELEWGGQTQYEKARVTGSDLGKEMWAFIPKHALPYLKYQMETDYCHVYTVDLSPYIFDASIAIDMDTDDNGTDDQYTECPSVAADYWQCKRSKDSWRTILIGGMRTGGACKNAGSACTQDLNGDSAVDSDDCVNTPIANTGYSSYYALDVTDPETPILLWEFSDTDLGYSTAGPTVVRIGTKTDTDGDGELDFADPTRNGRWYVVFGSGPTGPLDTTTAQFLGNSDQKLRIFIIDLKTGSLLREIESDKEYAFSGSLLNSTNDTDTDYQDDVIYVPYVRKNVSDNKWTQGGVLRILTNEDQDPAVWDVSTLIDGIGPVTSSVVRLQNTYTNKFWVYLGTGRYFFESATDPDDKTSQRHLMGLTEPCFSASGSFTTDCSTTRAFNDLTDVTDLSAGSTDPEGWYIRLDTASGNYAAERAITDPLSSTVGLVYFTSYVPYADICSIGGKSYLWAIKYDTGGAPGSLLKGSALIQVSTGSIEKIDLASEFTEKGGRRSSSHEGVPPTAQGLSIMTTPPPIKRVIHTRER